jgi:hypothetical protein
MLPTGESCAVVAASTLTATPYALLQRGAKGLCLPFDGRVARIRMFTVPGRPVGIMVVHRYALVAADWEWLRLRVHNNPLPVLADDELFSAQTVTLRKLSIELGLKTCTTATAGTDGIAGITDLRGFLPNDPGYLRSSGWVESTEELGR